MNDPGFDDAVADQADTLDRTSRQRNEENEFEGDPQYPLAGRWWLASTLFPLIAVCPPSFVL